MFCLGPAKCFGILAPPPETRAPSPQISGEGRQPNWPTSTLSGLSPCQLVARASPSGALKPPNTIRPPSWFRSPYQTSRWIFILLLPDKSGSPFPSMLTFSCQLEHSMIGQNQFKETNGLQEIWSQMDLYSQAAMNCAEDGWFVAVDRLALPHSFPAYAFVISPELISMLVSNPKIAKPAPQQSLYECKILYFEIQPTILLSSK